ncbi:MAG TPA: toprim domain-containing protein [Steroidobacteraceae bacterium]|jgi:putative DNA primase/helicase|nr:toprim domain-containing protein [Steroidobacteraceae bacterium]
MISAADIHARVDWPAVLMQVGIPEKALSNRHGPCPGCGGKDCFRFDHAKRGNGSFYCNKFGSGDGFRLLEHAYGWSFTEARRRVIEAAGLEGTTPKPIAVSTLRARATETIAAPSERVRRLRRERCAIQNCDDAIDYLASRHLWPLPESCSLSAHASVEYWNDDQRIGKYPSLIADVTDVSGELVTVHATYLQGGKKLTGYEPRKILSPMTGREGCAVRLMPATEVLGIAEGLETALSAAALDGLPVWAALNTSLLARFEPPPGVIRLRLYADRDEAGLTAAVKLMQRLQGRVLVEVRIPPPPAKDWNDVLTARTTK